MNASLSTFLARCGIGFACLSAWAVAQAAAQQPPLAPQQQRPNIVFILIDDAGFSDFGSYGGEIATPNLDSIARAGVRLTNFHTASTCEASRAMLQTGVDNHLAGAGTLKVVIADNQRGKPGYEGYLSDKAHSLGRLLHDGGYATYYAGKWDLGDGLERSPGAKGWDRYISLEQTGADNFEDKKVYAPLNLEAVRWEDGHPAQLPSDFFSTRHYVDKMIQYVDEGKGGNKPFFAMIALQAVHSPLQAPNPDIDKYLHRYDAGWEKIRYERYQRQVQMGLMPGGLVLPRSVLSRSWDSLTVGEQREYAKKMAVFAGMLDNADQHIGRFRDYLKQAGMLDNTVFIAMSDNGADPYELNKINLPFHLWYEVHFSLDYETLGQKGSYVHYGNNWAEVSNTPFAMFKGTSGEGGMRVPFIVSYPGRIAPGSVSDQFAYATDFLPTVLDIAGIAVPDDGPAGRHPYRPSGVSMLPHLEGNSPRIHPVDEAIGFESTGSEALFKGDYKLLRNRPPLSDGQFKLVDLRNDPVEAHDLSASQPALFKDMQSEMETYVAKNGVIRPPPDYDGIRQLLLNNWPTLARQLAGVIAAAAGGLLAILIAAYFLLRAGWRRWRGPRRIAG